MVAGKPRTLTPSKEETLKLGKDLVEWASKPTQDHETPGERLRFAEWYCIKHFMIAKQFKALQQLPEFKPFYEKARSMLAIRLVNAGQKGYIKEGIAHRFLRYYCDDVRESENDKILFEAEAKKKQDDEAFQKKIIEKDDELMKLSSQLLEAQEHIDKLKSLIDKKN